MLIKQTKNMTERERIAVENSNNQFLQALSYVAVGTIFPFSGETAPDTFMICDGRELDITEYSELFNVIGYTYGGSGETFKLPDMRGKTLVGMDDTDSDFNKIGKSGGGKNHSHKIDPDKVFARIYQSNALYMDWKRTNNTESWTPSDALKAETSTNTTTADGGVGVYGNTDNGNNMPPYIVCNYIIKVMNAIPKEIEIKVSTDTDKDYIQIINEGESLSIFHSMAAGLYLLKAGSSINYLQSARWVKDSGIFPDGEDSIVSVLNVYTDTEVIVSPWSGLNTVPDIYVDCYRYIYINQGVYGNDDVDAMAEKITSDNVYVYKWQGTTNDDRTEAYYTATFTKQESSGIPVDQEFNPESPNAQSGIAMAQVIGDIGTALDDLHAYAQGLVNGGVAE